MAPAAFMTVPLTNKKAPYDAVRDFAPITQTASLPSLIVLHPSVSAQSVKEMIALTKSKPGCGSVQWFGLLAPAGTPREIIARLHSSCKERSRQRR